MKRPPWTGTSLTSGSQRDITAAWLNRIKGSNPADNADKAAGGTTGVSSNGNVKSFVVKTVNNTTAEIPAMLIFKKIYEDMQLGYERFKAELKDALIKFNGNKPYEGLDWGSIIRHGKHLEFHVSGKGSLVTVGSARHMKASGSNFDRGEAVQFVYHPGTVDVAPAAQGPPPLTDAEVVRLAQASNGQTSVPAAQRIAAALPASHARQAILTGTGLSGAGRGGGYMRRQR
jgi:hypothetical protein